MNDLLLEEAVSAIKAGHKERGRQLLEDLLADDPQNEKALLWMTAVTNDPFQRRHYLHQILQINPNHKQAKRGLAQLATLPEEPRSRTVNNREQLSTTQPLFDPTEREPLPPRPPVGQEPWNKPEWRNGIIKPHNALDALFLAVFGGFWLFAGLIAYEPLGSISLFEWLIRLSVAIFGVALMMVAFLRARRNLRFASSRFRMDVVPGMIGGEVQGTLFIAGQLQSQRPLIVRLINIEKTVSKMTSESPPTVSIANLYEHAQTFNTAELQTKGKQTIVPIAFTIPYNDTKDATANVGNTTYRWTLQVKCELAGPNLDLDFTLPIFRTADSDPTILNLGEPARSEGELDAYLQSQAEQRCIQMEKSADGVQFTAVPRPPLSYTFLVGFLTLLFPAMIPVMINVFLFSIRFRSTESIFSTIISIIFIIVTIVVLPIPILFSWIMIKQFFAIMSRRQTWVKAEEVHYRTTLFGLHRERHISRQHLRIVSKESPGSRSGKPYYKVTLSYYDGEKKPENARVAVLANEIDSEAEAAWFVGALQEFLPELGSRRRR